MRTRTLAAALLVPLALLAVPTAAPAVVVVRHPVYRPVAVVATVAVVAVVVAKPPPTPPPPPTAPPPPPVTSPLPIDSTMWVLPSGCLKVSVKGEPLFQCGPSWLKQQVTGQGQPYYQVIPPPAP